MEHQARSKASEAIERVSRTMDLEGQGISAAEREILIDKSTATILSKKGAQLWD